MHEFSHPSQFRCLGYYPNQGDILVGTEEANILTFRLPTSITGKGVGRYTEEVRASHASHGEGKEGEMENAFASKYDEEEESISHSGHKKNSQLSLSPV